MRRTRVVLAALLLAALALVFPGAAAAYADPPPGVGGYSSTYTVTWQANAYNTPACGTAATPSFTYCGNYYRVLVAFTSSPSIDQNTTGVQGWGKCNGTWQILNSNVPLSGSTYYGNITCPATNGTDLSQWALVTGTHVLIASSSATDLPSGTTGAAPPPPAIALCPSTTVTDVAGSYSGGALAVRFKWLGTVPTGGWDVYAPDRAPPAATPSTTPTMVIPSTANVDGSPGYYAASAAVTAPAAMTYEVRQHGALNGNQGCYKAGTLSSNPVNAGGNSATTPGAGSGDSTDENGQDCGAWWHIACHIKAALRALFIPSGTTQSSVQAFGNTMANKAPFGYVAGTVASWNAVLAEADFCSADMGHCNAAGDTKFRTGSFLRGGGAPYDEPGQDIIGDPGHQVLSSLRAPLTVAVWLLMLVPLGLWVMRSLSPSGGSE